VRTQRWVFGIGGLLVAIAVAVVLVVKPFDDDDEADVETTAPEAAGDCVALADELPEGAPDVPVQVGSPPTELVIEDLVVGEGAEVVEGSSPTMNYIGVSCSTGKIFDSSYAAGQPIPLTWDDTVPGGWAVIAGWQQGLLDMKVGGQRLLGIPPDLAYAETGSGELIGPNETLWFVVEAVEVAPAATTDSTVPATTETTTAATPTS